MTETQLDAFSRKYKNWTFSKVDGSAILMTATNDKLTSEIPEIIETIYESYPGKKLSISVENDIKLSVLIKSGSQKKYSKMYTSGCFDIFHYGHLNILRRTKELCDYLIVGVSTDELIAKEKGKRPIIPYEERAKVIESITYVDEVIPQVDKDKQKIVDRYNIDAISVGDDWKGRYPKVSCEMEYFPYTASVSSTTLKDTLKVTEKA